MTTSKARPPAGLGPEGRTLWREITTETANDGLILDARERRWLLDAAREADLCTAMMTQLEGAPFMVKGSQGQDVINPLVSELRMHRGVIGGLLARIKLTDPSDGAGTGTGSRTTSTQARTAALARHRGIG
jgi:hypothetical protein